MVFLLQRSFLIRTNLRKNRALGQLHDLYTLLVLGCLDLQKTGRQQQHPSVAGSQHHLCILAQAEDGCCFFLGIESIHQFFAVGLGLVGAQADLCHLAVFKAEEHISLKIGGHRHIQNRFTLIHSQLGRDEVAQNTGFGVLKLAGTGLVDLSAVGEKQ